MNRAEILEELRRMPPTERRKCFEQIEEEFADNLTPEQIVELESRADELRKNPQSGISWKQVRAEARQRLSPA